jgi:hypothetical protein
VIRLLSDIMLDMLLGKGEKALRKSTGVLVDMGF